MERIVLVSTPWPLFNRPSVQIGALKAFVRQNLPEIQVDANHIYLSIADGIGYDLYGKISDRTWLAESPYAALLYPNKMAAVERFWKRRSSGVPVAEEYDVGELCSRLERISCRVVDSEDWSRYVLAGFSICFGQLTSSLFFIREIKKREPPKREKPKRIVLHLPKSRPLEGDLPGVEVIYRNDQTRRWDFPGVVKLYRGGETSRVH